MSSNHTKKYKLKSDRLILTEITFEDLNDIHALHSLKEVDNYNTLGIPRDIQDTRDFIRPILQDQHSKERKQICWVARDKSSKDFIGIAGLIFFAKRFKMAEIYFKLSPANWGKGYATELAKRILKFAFKDLNLHRIEAGVATENIMSIRVLEKLGMTREGSRRKILPIRGEWKDNYHYAILEEEFDMT
jgi:RimJ/RimL family protein N-acetyltransferase